MTGETWALIHWSAPLFRGDLRTISKYGVKATPQPFEATGSLAEAVPDATTAGDEAGQLHARLNSSCVEFECEMRYEEVPADELMVNLTGLVPAIDYFVVVFAFSNGSNLKSGGSQQITFSTLSHGRSI